MTFEWCKFILAAFFLITGITIIGLAVFGVNRFHWALNRMHAAALGDTLGILFVILGLMVIRGFSMDSLKLLLLILFFWVASPVSGHMISRLEVATNENLTDLPLIDVSKPGAADPDRASGPDFDGHSLQGSGLQSSLGSNGPHTSVKTGTQKGGIRQ